MDPIAPSTIRYIKLGAGGSFARASLERNELQLGYHEVQVPLAGGELVVFPERYKWRCHSWILLILMKQS